jgi:signal transduction histidine kinase
VRLALDLEPLLFPGHPDRGQRPQAQVLRLHADVGALEEVIVEDGQPGERQHLIEQRHRRRPVEQRLVVRSAPAGVDHQREPVLLGLASDHGDLRLGKRRLDRRHLRPERDRGVNHALEHLRPHPRDARRPPAPTGDHAGDRGERSDAVQRERRDRAAEPTGAPAIEPAYAQGALHRCEGNLPAVPDQDPSPTRPQVTSSIAARLALSFGLPSVVVVIALGLFAWWGARGAVLASLERELEATAAMGAATVNSLSLSVIGPGAEDTRSYRNLQRRLQTIKAATGSARVLVMGDDDFVRVDADGKLPILGLAPRATVDRSEIKTALGGTPTVGTPFTDDAGRRLLAAYAPIPERKLGLDLEVDDAPQRRYVLALEAPAETLDALDEVATYLIAVVLLFVGLVLGLASVVARTITRPLLRLADGAGRLAEGGLKRPLAVPAGRDEVALLGRTLEDMRQALLTRDEERQMMLAGIAHEVRNPLGGMELFSGLLEEEIAELDPDGTPVSADAKDDLASHAARVRRELRYLTGVVNDFLAYARETSINRALVDVPALLEDVRSLKHADDLAAVTLDLQLDNADARFPLDRGRIKESLLNLVGNAQQATDKGGEVILRARRGTADAGRDPPLILEVIDSGKGIDAATLERIFQPFFTTKEKGSGLGLPLVRKFARDHGGDAEVESTPGKGTCVRLVLAWQAPGDHSGMLAPEDEPGLLGDDEEPALLGDDDEPALLGDDDEPALLGDG